MDITDNELVRLVIQRNETAFEEIIRRYGGLVKSIVRYHLKDISMWQEDCVNDVFFKIWQNADRFDYAKNTLKNWIGAVSKYCAIDYKRRFYRELTAGELNEDIADEKEIDAELLGQEIKEETISLLSGLKKEDREIFMSHYIMEQSVEHISEVTGKKTSIIYNRLSRGRKKLRRMYDVKRSE